MKISNDHTFSSNWAVNVFAPPSGVNPNFIRLDSFIFLPFGFNQITCIEKFYFRYTYNESFSFNFFSLERLCLTRSRKLFYLWVLISLESNIKNNGWITRVWCFLQNLWFTSKGRSSLWHWNRTIMNRHWA